MKLYGALAILALPGAVGFAPNNNNAGTATALSSSGAPVSDGPAVGNTARPVGPEAPGGGIAVAGRRPPAQAPDGALGNFAMKFDSMPETIVQGGALRTWSFPTMSMGRVNLALTTQGPPEGNPLNVDIAFNEGPDNTPQRMRVYSGKGRLRPYKMWIETPSDTAAVFIRNLAPLEFPCEAKVGTEYDDVPPEENMNVITDDIFEMGKPNLIQGAGALRSYALEHSVSSVKVRLTTDGRPLNAMVELVQGPNAPKYTIEVYTEDGMLRPFTAVLETPGAGNELRIVNTASMEFPLTAAVGRSGQWPL
eukprot:scaffold2619_cov129-Cylindrotheca_fusiformis.AAC.4